MFVRDFPSGKTWLPGSIATVDGPQSFHVTLEDCRTVRRHVDHVRFRSASTHLDGNDSSEDDIDYPVIPAPVPLIVPPVRDLPEVPPAPQPPDLPPAVRRSTREVEPLTIMVADLDMHVSS